MKKIVLFFIIIFTLVFAATAKDDRATVEAVAAASPLHNETTQIFSNKDLPKGGGENIIFNNASAESAGISVTVWQKKHGWSQGTMARLASGQKIKTIPPKDIENYNFFAITSIDKKQYIYSFTAEKDDLVINIMDK